VSRRPTLAAVLLMLAASTVSAHVASTGFMDLDIRGPNVSGSLELAMRDAELAVGLDTDHDGDITWKELRASEQRLAAYLTAHVELDAGRQPCDLSFGRVQVNGRVDGNYAWLPLIAHCPYAPHALVIRYRILEQIDPSHRGLLRLRAGSQVQTAVLGGPTDQIMLNAEHPSVYQAVQQYFEVGIWHIWSGIDHLLFLLSLLLPAVLVWKRTRWEPVASGWPAFRSVLTVVTAFTLAHSITLSLAALGVVHLPTRVTESVIAASIVVAALNNIFPIITEARARIAFGFGLLHGFGFASVLSEMGLPTGARLASLVAFNCGIEVGQLAVVVAVMPLAYLLRRQRLYRHALLPWGSAAIAALALVWFVQRAFTPS
jgi:HupE / UreJ protein